MTPTQLRDRALSLAVADTQAALTIARSIKDPWFACQALAWVGRFASNKEFLPIVKESLRVGRRSKDKYKALAVAAWPVRALVERRHTQGLPGIMEDLLLLSEDVSPKASRSEALFLLFQAVFPAGRDHWRPVLRSLCDASIPIVHWRQGRNLLDTVLIVSNEDPSLASELIEMVDDPKLKGRIERALVSQASYVRPFFWTSDGVKR